MNLWVARLDHGQLSIVFGFRCHISSALPWRNHLFPRCPTPENALLFFENQSRCPTAGPVCGYMLSVAIRPALGGKQENLRIRRLDNGRSF
jgi:hypothetical protein